jgi:hypothetical protein
VCAVLFLLALLRAQDRTRAASLKAMRAFAGGAKMRVRSGTRVMTVRQALKDEIQGGDFLALMTDKEYQKFQKLLCKRGIKEKQNTFIQVKCRT